MAEYQKKISIIIPCYNSSEYLERSLKSLKEQTIGFENLEIIFVNDCSTDEGATFNRLRELEKTSPDNIMVIDLPENKGPGGARNVGVSYASGEFLQFFDADDELRNDACEILYNCARDNDADIIQFNHLFILGDERRSSAVSRQTKLYNIETKEDRLKFLDSTIVTYGCTNKLYRTELVRNAKVRFPDNLRYEEPLFVYPLFLYAQKVMLLNEDLYLYYFNDNSMITSKLGKTLLHHPQVQLMLLEDLMNRKELYIEYRDVIGIYFLWSFYCETINYAGTYPDAYLPIDYFAYMQNVCRTFFSDYKDNSYYKVISEGGRKLLDSIDVDIKSQAELNLFLQKAKDLI